MFEWSEEQLMIRDAVRQFVAGGDRAPTARSSSTATCRPTTSSASCSRTFGMDAMAREGFKARIEREKRIAAGEEEPAEPRPSGGGGGGAGA